MLKVPIERGMSIKRPNLRNESLVTYCLRKVRKECVDAELLSFYDELGRNLLKRDRAKRGLIRKRGRVPKP